MAHKLNRKYIGVEIDDQMTDLVVRRLNSVIAGEQGGISQSVNWQGGGEFAYYDFDKAQTKMEQNKQTVLYHLGSVMLWSTASRRGLQS